MRSSYLTEQFLGGAELSRRRLRDRFGDPTLLPGADPAEFWPQVQKQREVVDDAWSAGDLTWRDLLDEGVLAVYAAPGPEDFARRLSDLVGIALEAYEGECRRQGRSLQ